MPKFLQEALRPSEVVRPDVADGLETHSRDGQGCVGQDSALFATTDQSDIQLIGLGGTGRTARHVGRRSQKSTELRSGADKITTRNRGGINVRHSGGWLKGGLQLIAGHRETVVSNKQQGSDGQDDVHSKPSDAFRFLHDHQAKRKGDVEQSVRNKGETCFDSEQQG